MGSTRAAQQRKPVDVRRQRCRSADDNDRKMLVFRRKGVDKEGTRWEEETESWGAVGFGFWVRESGVVARPGAEGGVEHSQYQLQRAERRAQGSADEFRK